MKPKLDRLSVECALAILLVLPLVARAQDNAHVIFGLTNTPLGTATLSVIDGNLLVRGYEVSDLHAASSLPSSASYQPTNFYESYGVSVNLSAADSGLFFYPQASGFVGGEFMIGRCYGEVNGQPDELISLMRAVRVEYAAFSVLTDFSALGASRLTFEVYARDALVDRTTGMEGPFYIYSDNNPSPRANPFWRLPDGSVAATVELNGLRDIRIPGSTNEYLYGDRVVIRPEQPTAQAAFASRLDVTAGGNLREFAVTDERLGVFRRSHRALGQVALQSAPGQLTVVKIDEVEYAQETSGVLVELRAERHFSLDLAPVDFSTNGSSIAVNVVGKLAGAGTEMLGTAGLRGTGGTREFYGNFVLFDGGLLVCVYQDDCLVGTALSPTTDPVVSIMGNARLTGVDATAETGRSRPGLAFRLDAPVNFTLPDGSTLAGNRLQFTAANPQSVDQLTLFSLLTSNLQSFTIIGESGSETVHLADYLPEFNVPASLKRFEGTSNGQLVTITQSVGATNHGGQNLIAVVNTAAQSSTVQYFSFREDDLIYQGGASDELELFSEAGLRLLPVISRLGQTYQGIGSFHWRDTNSGAQTPVTVSVSTRVAATEIVTVPAGTFQAVRVETATTFGESPETNAPVLRYATNWLARGVGVVQFGESEVFGDGSTRNRSGRLTTFNVIDAPPVYPVANVGADIELVFRGALNPLAPPQLQWRKNGVAIAGATNISLILPNVQSSDAGTYAVTVGNSAGALTGDAAVLRIIPFSDTPDTWAASALGSNGYVRYQHVATDRAGNSYVAGSFRGRLVFGTTVLNTGGLVAEFYLAKYDPAGQLLWAKKTGGPVGESLTGLAVDGTDHVYLTGQFRNSATFGPFALSAPNRTALFVAKADSNGNFVWAKGFAGGTNPSDSITAWTLAVSATGTIHVGGNLYGAATLGSVTLDSTPYYSSMFVAKLDTSGNVLWARQSTGGHYSSAGALALDENGGVYFGGTFYEQIRFGDFVLNGPETGFLTRLDADGNFLRAEAFGISVNHLALAPGGSLYVHGSYVRTLAVGGLLITSADGPGTYYSGTYLAKLAPSGTAEWLLPVGNPDGSGTYGEQIAADGAGNLFMSERFSGTKTVGTTRFNSPEGSAILAKYGPGGSRLWVRQISNGGYTVPAAVATDPTGNVFLSGIFAGTVRFGGSTHVSMDSESFFLLKIGGATAPVISAQPQSQTVNAGEAANFRVTATGTGPLEYQWSRNGVNIVGATNAIHAIAQTSPDDAGSYAVVVRNLGGSAVSHGALLQVAVTNPPVFTFSAANFNASEPAGSVLIEILRTGDTGSAAGVTVETVNQSALAGQDYVNTAATLMFAPGIAFMRIAVPIVQDGLYETSETAGLRLCRPTGGALLGVPNFATLTISDDDPPAPVIFTQPRSRSVIEGRSATLSVVANGEAPLLYQWRKNGADILGATSATYFIASAVEADDGTYTVVVRNAAGEVTSAGAVLTVRLLPRIVQQPQDIAVPYGENATFTVGAILRSPAQTNRFRLSALGLGEVRIPLNITARGGTLRLDYDFGSDPDSITIFDAGNMIHTTGPLAGAGTFTANASPGPARLLEIVINEGAVGDNDGWALDGEFLTSGLGYQWFYNSRPIPGAMESTYAIPVARYGDSGSYSVVVSDNVGAVRSSVASLLVTPPALRISAAASASGFVQAFWNAPDHILQATTRLDATTTPDSWENLWSWESGSLIPIGGTQQYFRLRWIGGD